MNYRASFIQIADDCPASMGTKPPEKANKKTIANHQFDLLAEHSYQFTQEDIQFEVHLRHKKLSDLRTENYRKSFLAKPLPCLRTSPLAKRYGWGLHFDEVGKIALVAKESEVYEQICQDPSIFKLKALRSSRS